MKIMPGVLDETFLEQNEISFFFIFSILKSVFKHYRTSKENGFKLPIQLLVEAYFFGQR